MNSTRLLGRPQPQMYPPPPPPPSSLNQYTGTWVNRTHKHFYLAPVGGCEVLFSLGLSVYVCVRPIFWYYISGEKLEKVVKTCEKLEKVAKSWNKWGKVDKVGKSGKKWRKVRISGESWGKVAKSWKKWILKLIESGVWLFVLFD